MFFSFCSHKLSHPMPFPQECYMSYGRVQGGGRGAYINHPGTHSPSVTYDTFRYYYF